MDAWNAFNKLNHKVMLWHVCHYWPSGCWFAFNIYWHWKVSVLWGTDDFVFSMEGVSQGDLMAMFLYALCVLLITNQLTHHQLDVELLICIVKTLQGWYTDDSAKAKFFEALQE
eukprot:12117915-Ditylum_brightwellii.AAC.1